MTQVQNPPLPLQWIESTASAWGGSATTAGVATSGQLTLAAHDFLVQLWRRTGGNTDYIEAALSSRRPISITVTGDVTMSAERDTAGGVVEQRYGIIILAGSPSAAFAVNFTDQEGRYFVVNTTSQVATVKTATDTTGVTLAAGRIDDFAFDASFTVRNVHHVSATDRLLGRDTAGAGPTEELSLNATLEFTGAGAVQRAALTGHVTASAGSNATVLNPGGAVTVAADDKVLILDTSDTDSFQHVTAQSIADLTATLTDEEVQDIVGAMVTGNTETLITVTYQDVDGTIDFEVQEASIDHGSIAGLADDDHTQYALLAGRATGQTLIGGTAAGDDIHLQTTSNVSKGTYFLDDLTGNGFVKTSGGTGALSIDTNTYLTSVSGGDHGTLTGLTDDDHTQYLLADGTRALSAAWDAGSFQIRAETFQSDIATGTAPLVVASTTVVTNLNADTVDGENASAIVTEARTVAALDGATLTAVTVASDDKVLIQDTSDLDNIKTVTASQLTAGGGGATTALDNLASVAINTSLISDTDITDDLGSAAIRWKDVYAQTAGTGDTATDTFTIRARDVDGATWESFLVVTAGNTPSATLNNTVIGGTTAAAGNFTTVDATGNITVGGTVDGRDIATDGTKLDTIETSADVTDETNVVAALDGATLTAVTAASDDKVLIQDTSDLDNIKTVTVAQISGGSGASTALDNLASVAINTSLISDTDITDDLGSAAIRWANAYSATLRTGDTATDTLLLQARDVDGAAWTTFLTLTAANTPTADLAAAVTIGGNAILDSSDIGSTVQAQGAVLDDFNSLGAASADGEFIVATGAGVFAYESGATARTSMGVGTADNPQFATLGLGAAASATTALLTPAGTTGVSSLRVPHGVAPTAPVNGDIWSDTSSIYARINGATVDLGAAGAGGANTALSNLASVAINTSLVSDTDSTDNIGSSLVRWATGYFDDVDLSNDLLLASGSIINFDAGDITLTHSANLLAFAGGNFAVDGVLLQGVTAVTAINNPFSLGTTSANYGTMQLTGSAGVKIGVGHWAATATPPILNMFKSRNTVVGSNTIVADDDYLAAITAGGDDGTDYGTTAGRLLFRVNGTPAISKIPTEFILTLADGSVADSQNTYFNVLADGSVGLGMAATASTPLILNLSTSDLAITDASDAAGTISLTLGGSSHTLYTGVPGGATGVGWRAVAVYSASSTSSTWSQSLSALTSGVRRIRITIDRLIVDEDGIRPFFHVGTAGSIDTTSGNYGSTVEGRAEDGAIASYTAATIGWNMASQDATESLGNAAGESMSAMFVISDINTTTLRAKMYGQVTYTDEGGSSYHVQIGGTYNPIGTALNVMGITLLDGTTPEFTATITLEEWIDP